MLGSAFQLSIQLLNIQIDLAAQNLLFRGAFIAKLAHVNRIAVEAQGWAKGAAGGGAPRVEIAFAGLRIEGRTKVVIAKLLEPFPRLRVLTQDACGKIAWEKAQIHEAGALADFRGPGRIGALEFLESFA